MKKLLNILILFCIVLCLSSFNYYANNNISVCRYELVDQVYIDKFIGTDYRHDIYKTDRKVKIINQRMITGWAKKADNIDMTIGYASSVSGTISSIYRSKEDISLGFNLDAILSKTLSESYELTYSYAKEDMAKYEWYITDDLKGDYINIGLNVECYIYEINNYKQEFKWFGQGDYHYISTMEILVPTRTYIALNYSYFGDENAYEYKIVEGL